MEAFNTFWVNAVSLIWGLPLVVLLTGAGAYFTVITRFLPFRAFRHAIDIICGKYDRPEDPGEISHFQALSSALSATVGMGNIAGVAVAVAIGGPGAIFWMWVSGLVGMSTKFFTCSLACMYRKEDEDGIPQGGPMYFIEVGLGRRFKFLAIMFACCGHDRNIKFISIEPASQPVIYRLEYTSLRHGLCFNDTGFHGGAWWHHTNW